MNIIEIDLDVIAKGATNPRKNFNERGLDELCESISIHGVITPLLVRPDWCVGCAKQVDLEERRALALPIAGYELVSGERRQRASIKADLKTVPCLVRELTDVQVLELQLIENLQREDLDPVDEAESYAQLLTLEGESGERLYTVATLAHRIGKSRDYVDERVRIVANVPAEGLDALRAGLVSFKVVRAVSLIPSARMRKMALQEVLHPAVSEEPLTEKATRALIRARYMVETKGAPFNTDAAELVPVVMDAEGRRCRGGACADCPFLSGNDPEHAGIGSKTVCTNPECYQMKVEAAWEEDKSKALKEGKRVLSDAEKLLDPVTGDLRFNTTFVDLASQVPKEDLVDGVKRAPSWKHVLKDVETKPEVVVARDAKGRVREFVDHRQAIAAVKLQAKSTGETPVIKIGTQRKNRDENDENKRRQEADKKRLEVKVAQESLLELFKQVANKGRVDVLWDNLVVTALDLVSVDARWFLCTTLNLSADQSDVGGVREVLLRHFASRPENEMMAAVLTVLVSGDLRWHGAGGEVFTPWAKVYGVDVGAIRKAAAAEAKEKKKAKTKRSKTVD